MNTTTQGPSRREAGFSLIETMIAMAILATGLLGLAGVFAFGLRSLAGSSYALIAREKAREAIESVHTARDTKTITWAQINNVSNGGVFVNGPQPLRTPGLDGLVNTADDAAAPMEMIINPGPDNLIGTTDDVSVPMNAFTRTIDITPVVTGGVTSLSLRQLTVTITFRVGSWDRAYTLTTYVSSIS